MPRYPNIHSIIPLYNCQKPCKICGKEHADRRIEIRFNSFRGSNEKYYIHQECIDGVSYKLSPIGIMEALGCCLTIPIPHDEFLKWRLTLVRSGYGSAAKVNINVKKGNLIPGNVYMG